MDFNLVDLASEQAAKTEALEHECAEYLFQKFDWSRRTAALIETLNNETPNRLDGAITSFMMMDSLTLRVLLESAAMDACEASAKTLVRGYGDNWRVMLEGADYE